MTDHAKYGPAFQPRPDGGITGVAWPPKSATMAHHDAQDPDGGPDMDLGGYEANRAADREEQRIRDRTP